MIAIRNWMTAMATRLNRKADEGATAVEYGIMVALIAAIIVGIVYVLGQRVKTGFQDTCDGLPGAACVEQDAP
jgi:pilus assembly protein Flp/PilA